MIRDLSSEVAASGFAIVEGVLSRDEVNALLASLRQLDDVETTRRRGGVFAVRNLLSGSPDVMRLAGSGAVRSLVEPVLGPGYFPVRGILFDKVPGANWKVPYHQDVTIAVQKRLETEGYGPWSVKAEVLHVQPPAELLENMMSVRVHLDECDEENGALRVIPGTHLHGRIPEREIESKYRQVPERVCAVGLGGALLMRPLLLHASSAATVPGHRRVVHLDFACARLPNGLRWSSEPG